MTSGLPVTATRVLVVDADRQSREAMTDRLRAAGYDALPVEDPNSRSPSEMGAEFAVLRGPVSQMDAMMDQEGAGGSASPSLAIGWLAPRTYSAADASGTDLEQARQHAARIFATIAPLFLDIDRDAAFGLAGGLYALGARITGPSYSDEPRGDSRPGDDDESKQSSRFPELTS